MPIARYYDDSKTTTGAPSMACRCGSHRRRVRRAARMVTTSVDASSLYRKTKPRADKAEDAPAEPEASPDAAPAEPDRKRR